MRRTIVFLLLTVGAVYLVLLAGSLEPPGPPAPTMKTLTLVEPRIPIGAADVPLTITSPGSYYLTEDIVAVDTGARTNWIMILANNVTVDLNGFSLILPGEPGQTLQMGMRIDGGAESVVVRNGTIEGFHFGIIVGATSNVHLRDLIVRRSGVHGINFGAVPPAVITNLFIEDCTVVNNLFSGIAGDLSDGSSVYVRDNVASDNQNNGILVNPIGSIGAYAGAVSGNRAFRNGNIGIQVDHRIVPYLEVTKNVSGNNQFDYSSVPNVSQPSDAGAWDNIAL